MFLTLSTQDYECLFGFLKILWKHCGPDFHQDQIQIFGLLKVTISDCIF